ncbi:hypothetical protein [Kibdelosporangium phytohabitans]|uniref:hypothetical protein n=1 Tax=Kibdelosporangium phytohabitans TaxID=860235 RepID=UPI00147031A9|nr:hypothetical protein [Kibdelosporangium phytohabitans]MBE1470463.1 hypothetical protein [Kibdelosporangium phytohabitans]
MAVAAFAVAPVADGVRTDRRAATELTVPGSDAVSSTYAVTFSPLFGYVYFGSNGSSR